MPTRDARPIAVVDPIASGGPYGEEGSAMGHAMIGVLSREFTVPYVAQSFQRERYREVYRHENVRETAEFLRRRQVAAVLPGTTTALALVDVFSQLLGAIGNPVETLDARLNKRVMKEHWTRQGVPCAGFYESGDLRAVQSWAEERGYPVVLKPNASAGSSHVYVCETEREVAAAFENITHATDIFDQRFSTVLVEEYLDGDEYFMNLLHSGGSKGELVSVARYDKIQRDGHASIYRSFKSLPLDDPVARDALPYIQAANAAIGVRYGINDTEYKLTSRGLKIIEVNNRLPGASTPLMIERCSGLNCFRENIRIFLGEYTPPATPYRFTRHYCVCCLINHRAGRVAGYGGGEEVRRLPSYEGMRMIAGIGEHWPVTIDLASAWGLVRLVHEDRAQLDRDAHAVHGLMRLHVE